jgi:hypothetical protein
VLIWVYYSAQLVLMGAEFTNVYARRYGSRRHGPAGDAARSAAKARDLGRTRAAWLTGASGGCPDVIRNILPHSFERRMRPGAMKLGDNIANGIADTGDLAQRVLGNHAIERLGERGQVLGSSDWI